MHIDVDSLLRTESELRERVEGAPANAEARRDLACCLILLAMYQAGIEQTTGRADCGDSAPDALMASTRVANRSAEQLLHEHLWHAQVLNMLPSARQITGPAFYDMGIGRLVGATLLASQVKSKYDEALRRLIADLQDPSQETLSGEGR
jgi:hypothetical protein